MGGERASAQSASVRRIVAELASLSGANECRRV